MSKLRKCIVDKTQYKYCGNCKDYNPNETWRYLYCSENCRQIYHTLDAYKAKKINEEEAISILEKLDLSNKDNFTDLANKQFEKIYPKGDKKINAKKVANVVENKIVIDSSSTNVKNVVENEEDLKDKISKSKKQTYNKKKSKKK